MARVTLFHTTRVGCIRALASFDPRPTRPMTDLVYSLSFADGLEAAEFLSRLEDYAATAPGGTRGDVAAWIRDPLVRGAAGAVCCVYITAAALAAARAAGLRTEGAQPIAADALPTDRIAVVGEQESPPTESIGRRGPPPG